VSLLPKSSRDLDHIDLEIVPPSDFIAGLMKLSVMTAAERDRELDRDA